MQNWHRPCPRLNGLKATKQLTQWFTYPVPCQKAFVYRAKWLQDCVYPEDTQAHIRPIIWQYRIKEVFKYCISKGTTISAYPRQGNICWFKENIIIRGNYIHSRKSIHLRNIYSFKFKAICSFKESIFIQQRCVRGHSRNIYSKIVPSHFMTIISFTITISWIKYNYNSFRLNNEEITDMIEGSVL